MTGIASNLPNIVDERVPCLDQRGTITYIFTAIPSMFKEHINVEVMLSAKVTRTRVKFMKF